MKHHKKVGAMARLQNNIKVLEHRLQNIKSNTSLIHTHAAESNEPSREQLSEREFVRRFGDKVRGYRLSNRPDFVGLTVWGKYTGFIITQNENGRKVRLIDVDEDHKNIHGKRRVTRRYLRVREHDSVSNMQRGLLRYVT